MLPYERVVGPDLHHLCCSVLAPSVAGEPAQAELCPQFSSHRCMAACWLAWGLWAVLTSSMP